jgi:hypothetical protein
MKKFVWILILFTGFSFFAFQNLRAEVKNKQLLGEWLYQVSDAPYGYEKGSLIFSEKDGQTVCVVKLEAGELAVNDLKIEKGKITFTATVEGNPVKVELTRENNKLSGKVDSPEGPKTLTAVKK